MVSKAEGGGGDATGVLTGPGGADGTGLIDPDLFPLTSQDIDLDGTMEAASAFGLIGTRVQDRSASLTASWSPLAGPGVYVAPESGQVHRLMEPAVEAGETFRSGAVTAQGALMGFWMTLLVTGVRGRLATLEDEARSFRDEVRDGVPRPSRPRPFNLLDIGKDETIPWYDSLEHTHRHDELLAEYAEILEDVSQAAVAAAEAIEKIPGMPDLPDVEPYDADAIADSPMPWGSPREPDLPFEQQIAFGVAGTVKDLAVSLAALAGWDGTTWYPQPGVAVDGWKGMGNGLLGLAVLAGGRKFDQITGGGKLDQDDIDRMLASDDPMMRWLGERLRDGEALTLPLAGGRSEDLEDAARRWERKPWQVGTETALAWLMLIAPGPKVKGVPMSPRAHRMVDDLVKASDLIQTGSGWYTAGGVRVADAAGRWLGDRIYGGSKGDPGGTHMWTPGEPTPTPADGGGGKHKPGKHRG